MIIHPEALADRGCWISGDRVYAFISSEHDGITAVGYHGAQPVSRNSRVFRGGIGAFRFFAWGQDGTLHRIHLTDFDWLPGILTVTGVWPSGRRRFSIRATGRNVVIAEEAGSGPDKIAMLFSLDSLTVDVHGDRSWNPGEVEGGRLHLEFRDRVLLDAWMRREGPYAGDFLIPEPIRRKIYRRRCRSGLATREDLLPEFQNSPFPLYDARVAVTLGGPAYAPELGENGWLFLPSGESGDSGVREFRIAFDAGRSDAPAESLRKRYLDLLDRSPSLGIPGFPEVEGFSKTVPGLVESCVVREIGVPRATPGEYYWVWAWDAMVTALASLRWGDLDGAGRIAAFVDGHRDEDGCIPMRWTRSLEPLDTQPRGSLESLLCSLVDAVAREGRDQSRHCALFPRMVDHLDHLRARSDDRGMFANAGFYPDLPLRFGRTERSAVALEVGAFYTFCRTCANVATALGDRSVARRAEESASRIEASFLESFWDAEKGFVNDSRDLGKLGSRAESQPSQDESTDPIDPLQRIQSLRDAWEHQTDEPWSEVQLRIIREINRFAEKWSEVKPRDFVLSRASARQLEDLLGEPWFIETLTDAASGAIDGIQTPRQGNFLVWSAESIEWMPRETEALALELQTEPRLSIDAWPVHWVADPVLSAVFAEREETATPGRRLLLGQIQALDELGYQIQVHAILP